MHVILKFGTDIFRQDLNIYLKGFDLKNATFKLYDSVILPDTNMHVIKEANANDQATFSYFLLLYNHLRFELEPNSPHNPYEIIIAPISNTQIALSLMFLLINLL